jgi:large subunit ribosomal protein L22
MGYTGKFDQERMARAYGKELHVSPKHSMEICKAIRGMHVLGAKDLLESVISLKEAIPFKKYNKCVPHQKGTRGAGRYPVKAAKEILKVIKSAQANAEKTLDSLTDPDEMRIVTAVASRGRKIENWMPRAHGRWTPFNEETTNVEIILEILED